MTFWSSQTLAEKLPTLISPCDPKRIEQASYTLGIGKEIFITKDRHNSDSQHTKRSLNPNEAFVIPPGQFAFLLTEESVIVPIDAIAFISMKASFKFKGLINISGFHVDPGFSGNLLFSVFNAGPSPIHIRHNQPCFLIWYASLDRKDSNPRKGKGFSEIPMNVLNQISTDEIYSLQKLTRELQDIDTKVTTKLSELELVETQINFTKWIVWVTGGAILSVSLYFSSSIINVGKFAIQQKELIYNLIEYKAILDELVQNKNNHTLPTPAMHSEKILNDKNNKSL